VKVKRSCAATGEWSFMAGAKRVFRAACIAASSSAGWSFRTTCAPVTCPCSSMFSSRVTLERAERTAARPLADTAAPDHDVLGSGREVIRLGAAAASRGVLVGRYLRCATSIIGDGSQATVSRVHLLVILLDGALYAVDTASSNGTFVGEEPVRIVRLGPDVALTLGAAEAWVQWRVLN